MTPTDRAEYAKQLQSNPVFKQIWDEVKNDLVAGLESCGFQDIDAQHDLALSLQVLKRLKSKVDRIVEEGKFEQKKIEQLNWADKVRERLSR